MHNADGKKKKKKKALLAYIIFHQQISRMFVNEVSIFIPVSNWKEDIIR